VWRALAQHEGSEEAVLFEKKNKKLLLVAVERAADEIEQQDGASMSDRRDFLKILPAWPAAQYPPWQACATRSRHWCAPRR